MRFGLGQLGQLGQTQPSNREFLTGCGIDPDQILPGTNVPAYLYPGNLPTDVLSACLNHWNLPLVLPNIPPVYVFGGDLGRPLDNPELVADLIEAQMASGGAPIPVGAGYIMSTEGGRLLESESSPIAESLRATQAQLIGGEEIPLGRTQAVTATTTATSASSASLHDEVSSTALLAIAAGAALWMILRK